LNEKGSTLIEHREQGKLKWKHLGDAWTKHEPRERNRFLRRVGGGSVLFQEKNFAV